MSRNPGSIRLFSALVAMAGLLLISGSAHAEYSVQIGAFKEPAPSFTAAAEKVGKLYRSKSPTGLTRLQVGRFATKKEASIARTALLGAGYEGAFVVEKGVSLRAATDAARTSNTTRTYSAPRTAPAADPMAGVPADLRDRVVILDGRLHVVEGETFTPLDRYLRDGPRY